MELAVTMEVAITPHPNDGFSVDSSSDEYLDLDEHEEPDSEESEEEDLVGNIPKFVFIRNEIFKQKVAETDVEVEDVLGLLKHIREITHDDNIPRFSLDVGKLGLVPNIENIFANLNLNLSYRNILGRRSTLDFPKDFLYNKKLLKKFKTALLYRDGYLEEDSNYFDVDESHFRVGTQCSMLRNSRVILYWRNVNISGTAIRRSLSAGLLLLAGKLERSQLASAIRSELPNGQFEVSINYVPNSYVLIGIEAPVFRY